MKAAQVTKLYTTLCEANHHPFQWSCATVQPIILDSLEQKGMTETSGYNCCMEGSNLELQPLIPVLFPDLANDCLMQNQYTVIRVGIGT